MATKSEVDARELPPDFAEAFRRAGGLDERPETLGEGFEAATSQLHEAGATVTLEDMYQPEPTRHGVHAGDNVEYVPCVTDAMIVALLVDTEPVEIHSESPERGETVRFIARGDEITVTPSNAVVSFGLGIEESAAPALDALVETLTDPVSPIPTTCSVSNSFPDSEAYDRWALVVTDATVMELSVEKLFDLSQQAIEAGVVE